MLGSKGIGETKLNSFRRVGVRLGTLCGVLVMVSLNMGGCIFPPPPVVCTADANCATGLVCNPASGACVECLADADCAQGVCSEAGGNVCIECLLDAQCAAGQVCNSGQCVAGAACTADADCAAGQVCTNGQCVDEAGCTVDGDCAAGQVCINGACVAGGTGGNAAAGEAFYTANGCAACHGADATGGFGPNIQGESAAEIFARLSGAATHPVTVAGVTVQDSLDLEAWLGSL